MKYYFYNIFERNGNYEYNHKGVEILDKEDDAAVYFENKTKNYYSEGELEVVGKHRYYWHFGELVTRLDDFKEVTEEEYKTLSKFI